MSFKTKVASSLLSITIAAGAIAGTVEQSAAKKFSNGEVAAIAGIGGFILGATIANGNRGPGYYGHYSSWERHVDRCYARYNTYDHRTDTFVGYDGYEHRCRL